MSVQFCESSSAAAAAAAPTLGAPTDPRASPRRSHSASAARPEGGRTRTRPRSDARPARSPNHDAPHPIIDARSARCSRALLTMSEWRKFRRTNSLAHRPLLARLARSLFHRASGAPTATAGDALPKARQYGCQPPGALRAALVANESLAESGPAPLRSALAAVGLPVCAARVRMRVALHKSRRGSCALSFAVSGARQRQRVRLRVESECSRAVRTTAQSWRTRASLALF